MNALLGKFNKFEKAITDDDVGGFTRIIEELGFHSDIKENCSCPMHCKLLMHLYGAMATIVSRNSDKLNREMYETIIDRSYNKIIGGRFLQYVVMADDIDDGDYSEVPIHIRKAVKEGDFSEELAGQISGLNEKAAKQFIAYVFYELDEWRTDYIPAIAKLVYSMTRMPYSLLLAFLSACVVMPEVQGVNIVSLGRGAPIGDILSQIFGDIVDSKSEETPGEDTGELTKS